MSDYLALAILILLVVSVIVAAWYATRPRPWAGGPTSFVVTSAAPFAIGATLSIGTGKNMEYVRVIDQKILLDNDDPKQDRISSVTIDALEHSYPSGAPVTLNQRRAKRGR